MSIFKVWANQQGYVALPIKTLTGHWQERMFKWPDEKAQIKQWVDENYQDGANQYWCPTVFTAPQRIKLNIRQMTCLYADLDNVNPNTLPDNLRPSFAWESSPGRYAAIWNLEFHVEPKLGEDMNKKLTYFVGADKGGWDLTQVLRIPGSRNYKYDGAPKGKKLWYDDTKYRPETFVNLPKVETKEKTLSGYEFFESDPSKLNNYVNPYLGRLDAKTLKLVFASEADVLAADRSAKLWELECRLATQGIPREAIISIVACSQWNKYRTRADEAVRITTEVDKAIAHVGPVTTLEDINDRKLISYSELLGKTTIQPGWMIEGVWQEASHGIIAGEPKTYKSVIATDIGISVASGEPFLGHFPVHKQGPVIYVQEENAEWVVKDRVQKIATSKSLMDGYARVKDNILSFRPPQDIPFYVLNKQGIDLTLSEDRDYILELAEDVKPVLFIFDPLYLMLGAADENSSRDLRPILKWLLQLGNQFKASVMVLHHWNKHGKSSRGGQRLLGSTLLHGWVESAIYTSIVDEGKHIIKLDREFRSYEKPVNIEVQFQLAEPGEFFYNAIIKNAVRKDSDAVLELIKMSGRITELEIKESLSMTMKQVKDRLTKLSLEGKIIQNGNLWEAQV